MQHTGKIERQPLAEGHPLLDVAAIWHPRAAREGYVSVLFLRRFRLSAPPRHAVLWLSAAQRYELYLDGELISRGPPRSDPRRWFAVRVPLGPLRPGRHVLAVRVSVFGRHGGKAQLGGPGFLVVAAQPRRLKEVLDSGTAWECREDRSRRPIGSSQVGSGERVDGSLAPWGWEFGGGSHRAWSPARLLCARLGNTWGNRPVAHKLYPNPLPALDERIERLARMADGPEALRPAAENMLAGRGRLTIPARSRVSLVLDRGEPTNAYPVAVLSGGRGARLQVVAAEAPCRAGPGPRVKAHRDDAVGKVFPGQADVFLPDGGHRRVYSTLWFRAFRYLALNVRTAAEPLVIEDLYARFTAYPLRLRARFTAGRGAGPDWRRLWQVSWMTQRLCSHETFFDCPHYEQGQFPGDARIQALYHYLAAGDDRLVRKAIADLHASRTPRGLLSSHYPLNNIHDIPTYSLYWIGMLHDFLLYRDDTGFLGPYLFAAREIAEWFLSLRRPDGMLGRVPDAPFVDWCPAFDSGNAPQGRDGGSAILTLLLARACRWLADLERASGYRELAGRWRGRAAALAQATLRSCWDAQRGLLRDTAAGGGFSLHAQVEAVLCGAWSARESAAVMRRAAGQGGVAQPGTFYYRYYVAQALKRCGRRTAVLDLLEDWIGCLRGTGLNTWPETAHDNPRSDCHAWSVTPGIELLRTVLGVAPAGPGFREAVFEPTLGPLPAARGTVPTPHGPITVDVRRGRGGVRAELNSPVPVKLRRKRRVLPPGRHMLEL